MRKTIQVTKSVVENKTVDIICNKCGESCSSLKRNHNAKSAEYGFSGLEEVEIHGGYDSEIIGDMSAWRFSICEQCLSELVKTFKIPHEIKGDWSSEFVTQDEYAKLEAVGLAYDHQMKLDSIVDLHKQLGIVTDVEALKLKTGEELYAMFYELSTEVRNKTTN